MRDARLGSRGGAVRGGSLALLLMLGCGGSTLEEERQDPEAVQEGTVVADSTDQEARADFSLAFVLVSEAVLPDPERLVSAGAELGLELEPEIASPEGAESQQVFTLADGGDLVIQLVPTPHPDAANMLRGWSTPPEEQLVAAGAHYVVALLGAEGSLREQDVRLAKATGAVVAASPAVAAMLGHREAFLLPELFARLDPASGAEDLPIEVCVDMTVAVEAEDRRSLLTHGMVRYGREDLLVRFDRAGWSDALDFTLGIAGWLASNPGEVVPTGDTVGRDAGERIRVERGPHPIDESRTVMILSL